MFVPHYMHPLFKLEDKERYQSRQGAPGTSEENSTHQKVEAMLTATAPGPRTGVLPDLGMSYPLALDSQSFGEPTSWSTRITGATEIRPRRYLR
jgi:hypothetical protein